MMCVCDMYMCMLDVCGICVFMCVFVYVCGEQSKIEISCSPSCGTAFGWFFLRGHSHCQDDPFCETFALQGLVISLSG